MKRCDDYEALIERMLADEIDDAGRDRLLLHAESCAECRQYVELHHRLLGPELSVDLPTDEEFAAVRGAVLSRVRAEASRGAGWRDFLRTIWLRPALAGSVAALMLVALAAGVIVGRHLPGREMPLADVAESAFGAGLDVPVLYSNVSLRELGDRTVLLGYDQTRHVVTRRSPGDALVKRVLLRSLLNESSLGARLETMSHAGRFRDSEVKQAMILTMLNDAHQPVRQRALEILSTYDVDADIQSALIAVLRDEQSVNLRLMAMDLLASSRIPAERFGQLVDDLRERDDRALIVRAASYGAPGVRAWSEP